MTNNKSKKIRAKTLLQRMGFQDRDLKSSNHDNIVLWLQQDSILLPLLKEHFLQRVISSLKKYKQDYKIPKAMEKDYPLPKIIKKKLEFIIINERNYEVGFIDLAVFVEYQKDTCIFYFEVKSQYDTLGMLLRELNLYYKNTRIDKVIQKFDLEDIVNTNKRRSDFFYVVGPPNKIIENFPTILKEQGFYFIECPAELIKSNESNSKGKQKMLF